MKTHYIVAIHSGSGGQHYAHVELLDETSAPPAGGHFGDVVAGPADTAEEAWSLWHKSRGTLKP